MDELLKSEFAKKLGLDILPKEEQEEALIRMSNIIFRGVMLQIVDVMNEADQAELDRMITADPENTEAIFAFLRSKVDGFDRMVAEEIENYASDAMEIADQVK